MLFKTIGNKSNPAILFFHAMGVTGASSIPVAEYLQETYYCIMPTSTVYCEGQRYESKTEEIKQIRKYLAMTFLTKSGVEVDHVFFDG